MQISLRSFSFCGDNFHPVYMVVNVLCRSKRIVTIVTTFSLIIIIYCMVRSYETDSNSRYFMFLTRAKTLR
jgi:hypothetical protein